MSTQRIATRMLAAALLVLAAGQAGAQRATTGRANTPVPSSEQHAGKWIRGVNTFAAPGLSITGPDIDGTFSTTMGTGFGVMAGYALDETWSGYLSIDLARQATGPDVEPAGSFGLAHFEIGARYNLRSTNPVTTPFLTASVGQRALGARVTNDIGQSADVSLSGHFLAAGGGLQRVMSPHLSLEGAVEFAMGRFDRLTIDGFGENGAVNSSTSTRLRFGALWRP